MTAAGHITSIGLHISFVDKVLDDLTLIRSLTLCGAFLSIAESAFFHVLRLYSRVTF